MAICLTKEEIRELTGKLRSAAQVRVLAQMAIPYRVRPDGSPVVLYSDLKSDSDTVPTPQPDFSSLTHGSEAA
jgi:hypothetical protein